MHDSNLVLRLTCILKGREDHFMIVGVTFKKYSCTYTWQLTLQSRRNQIKLKLAFDDKEVL